MASARAAEPAESIDSGESVEVVQVDEARGSTGRERWFVAALVLGAVLAGGYLAIDARLSAAIDSADAAAIEDAARWFPHDPSVAALVSWAWLSEGGQPAFDRARQWAETSVARQPDRPERRDILARHYMNAGNADLAQRQLEIALDLQPNRVLSWDLLQQLGTDFDDPALAERAMAELCALGADACATD